MLLDRNNKSFIATWWWTVDRLTILAISIILVLSAIMVTTASPAVAERIGVESFYFIRKQFIYIFIAIFNIVIFSFLSPIVIRRLAFIGVIAGIILLIVTLVGGNAIKGSKRWLSLFGFSFQPSEFIKPFFSVTIGWVLAKKFQNQQFPAFTTAIIIYIIVATLLVLQPDLGMAITISTIWGGQLFLAGISMLWVILAIIFGIFCIFISYLILPHVARRINDFLDPAASTNYQATKSLEAFKNGGLYGKGPGEGTIKQVLPDSHTDFIFSVIGEELGILVCISIVFLFAFIVIRGFIRISKEEDIFVILASSGILIQFGIQSIINMGVTLNLLPTKGMTLPFISYGGSSMISVSIAVGMLLSLTKRKYGISNFKFKHLNKYIN